MIPASKLILYLTKTQKQVKFAAFSLKLNLAFHPNLIFFSLNNLKIALYFNLPEMFKFNQKLSTFMT